MKNLLDYIIENVKDEKYIASIEAKLDNKKLCLKELKMQEIIGFSNYLSALDIIKCKKIGIFMDNCNEFVNAFYSILLNNKIVVSICNNVEIDEFKDIVQKNNLKYVVTNDKCIEKISCLDKEINIINLSKLKIKESKLKLKPSKKKENDTLVVSYTSGTSGNYSKGVELTYKNITFVSEEYQKVYKLDNKSQIITVLPLWHNYSMFACLTSSIVAKSKLIIMDKWNANLFIEINKKLAPSVFPGSPYMYIDLINNHKEELINLSNLKVCDSGGDSLPIECINKFEKLTGAVITEGYGLTETASLTHFNYSAAERKVGSLGKTVSNTKCKILDLEGNPVKDGEWGLLWIKGPMVFKDYVRLPGMKKTVKKNGWFNTNDVVRKEGEYYYIAGRLSDLKALNIDDNQLRELENKLYKFEGISRVHVKTNYNEIAGFYYFDLFVILRDKYKNTDLYDYINNNLKDYVIGDVKIVADLPTTGTGKIKRKKVDNLLNININDYDKTELFGGLRCKTYLLNNEKDKYIYQEYFDSTIYQAKKKYDVINMVQNNKVTDYIAKAYTYSIDKDKTWLLTEYKEGKTVLELRNNKDFALTSIAEELAEALNIIHTTPVNHKYGWITDNDVYENDTFSVFLESELKRFSNAVKDKISPKNYKYMIDIAKEKLEKINKYESKLIPQLIWFDLNPNNILVNKKNNIYKLSSIIDAGGAKIGIKEWDLAFIKMETCINEEEYQAILNSYKRIDSSINEELIDCLCIFVELDDMIIRILDKVDLPIPYCSVLKNIIEEIKNER